MSGISRFSSGFPITLYSLGDNSLLEREPNGINNFGIDLPDYTAGPLNLSNNPRKSDQHYFNTRLFSLNSLGTPGNASRRFFHGPGMDNYDMALAKTLPTDGIQVPVVQDRDVQHLQSRAILWTRCRRRQHRRLGHHVRRTWSVPFPGRVMQVTAKFSF